MVSAAFIAYLHYLGFILLFTTLFYELSVFQLDAKLKQVKQLSIADLIYGVSSILILATGFWKIYYYGKGADYYWQNYFLIGKLLLFTVIGLLSIYPTIYFQKLKKIMKNDAEYIVPFDKYTLIKKIIYVEIILALFIPLFAALMARGFGYFG